ncbi:sensor histidine kinase [Marinomonas primoryensis]|uniref:histidine kinase n=1 Tax=Marinomonas primoryensis TaxID=178399 RepID=A0ABV0L086_9GAMM
MLVLLVRISTLNGWGVYPEQQNIFWKALAAISVVLVIGGIAVKIYKEKIYSIEKKGLIRELNIERKARFHQRQLVSIVSHEFRTSLSIISGAITNLKSFSNIDVQVAKRYDRIERSNERLIQLTDNCLADDRISSAPQAMQFKVTNLSEILLSAAKLVGLSDHHNMNVTFYGKEVNLSELPEIKIKADDAMLRIALSNVFDNALKYMEEGDLNVDIYHDENFYIVNVVDHGIGIDKDRENEIFERYKQVSRGTNATKAGVGFGLYICKQIMLGHGGDIRLINNSDEGCCFEFRIPKRLN